MREYLVKIAMITERITVETDLFEHRDVKPHFINPCCFGEDFAQWLKTRLSERGLSIGEPTQEDYGWGFVVSCGEETHWVAISYVGDGPQEPPPQWVISIQPNASLNPIRRWFRRVNAAALERVRDGVNRAISSEPRIRRVPLPEYGNIER